LIKTLGRNEKGMVSMIQSTKQKQSGVKTYQGDILGPAQEVWQKFQRKNLS